MGFILSTPNAAAAGKAQPAQCQSRDENTPPLSFASAEAAFLRTPECAIITSATRLDAGGLQKRLRVLESAMACRCRLPSQGTRAASIGRRGANKPQASSMLCRVIEHALRKIEKKSFAGIFQSEHGRFLGRYPARSTSLRYYIRSYSLRCLCRRSILKSSSRARHNANSA